MPELRVLEFPEGTVLYLCEGSRVLGYTPPLPREYLHYVCPLLHHCLEVWVREPPLSTELLEPLLKILWRYPASSEALRILAERVLKSLQPSLTRILSLLLQVPPGKVTTYKDLAQYLSVRISEVVRALRLNPYPILIPCHRVVRSSGEVSGYLGLRELWFLKAELLRREGVCLRGRRVVRTHFTTLTCTVAPSRIP